MRIHELEQTMPLIHYYDMRSHLQRHVYRRSDECFTKGDKDRDRIKTIADLKKRQQWVRQQFIASLGGLPSSQNNLNAKVMGVVEEPDIRIEKVIFESRPKTYITANLYIPASITKPSAAVLFLCGHYIEAKHHPEYQIVCRYLAKAGLIVLAQDPIGQGERLSYFEQGVDESTVTWGTREHNYTGAQCYFLGDSIARYFLHDAMRGVDYLCSRPEVDPKRIGVTGNSGGGIQTCMMMLGDTRIAAAAPCTYVNNRRMYMYTGIDDDAEQTWPGLAAAGINHEDFLLCMAPRPVRVLAVKYDFFPIEGTRHTVEQCRRFWRMCNAAEAFSLVEDTSTHYYTRNLAKSAAEFFSRHLVGRTMRINDADIQAIDSQKLICTTTGQIKKERSSARFVYDENVDRLRELRRQRQQKSAITVKRQAMAWLRKEVFRGREICAPNLRIFDRYQVEDMFAETGFWWSQADAGNAAILFRHARYEGKQLPVTIALWDGGTTALVAHEKWIRQECLDHERAVMVLDVSGAGMFEPHILRPWANRRDFAGAVSKYFDDLCWMGDSIAALRTYDVVRALTAMREWTGINTKDISLHLHGPTGFIGEFAAALDNRIKKIEMTDAVSDFGTIVSSQYYNSLDVFNLIMPGMLRYFDLPDLRKWQKKLYNPG